jgi:Flp pilus assembly pilin Flp
MKKILKNQDGWTTMEYVVGALIIIGIVSTAITTIQGGIMAKVAAVVAGLK